MGKMGIVAQMVEPILSLLALFTEERRRAEDALAAERQRTDTAIAALAAERHRSDETVTKCRNTIYELRALIVTLEKAAVQREHEIALAKLERETTDQKRHRLGG